MTSSNDAKATMKAVRIHAFGGPEELRYEDAPRPAPKAGEVLIRIHASAVNPADWKFRSGFFGKDIPLPLTLGFDFSGVIDTLGEGVTRWKVGDEVYGYALGAYAYRFAPSGEALNQLNQLISLERQCCRFLTFKMVVEAGEQPFQLEVTGPPEAQPIIKDLFGE